MKKRWWFTEYRRQDPVRWSWRLLHGDGTIDQQSNEFDSYGEAVRDAIVHGFQPARDHWAIETTLTVTHFERGTESIVVLKGDREPLIAPPPAFRGSIRGPKRRAEGEPQVPALIKR